MECPSCGGTSLSPTLDEGSLICNDCDEEIHGFRAEEQDDEGGNLTAAVARQSQASQTESRRLSRMADMARLAAKEANETVPVDTTRMFYESLTTIHRALIDALIRDNNAPERIIEPAYQILIHWVRMCHAGGVIKEDGCTRQHFSTDCILALVYLACLYVRCPTLPVDLCRLACENKIPYLTAARDLLPATVLAHDDIYRSFVPATLPVPRRIWRIASHIATCRHSWPPLQNFYNGPHSLYLLEERAHFPIGNSDVVLQRVTQLLGLPECFRDRVRRFQELRRVASATTYRLFELQSDRPQSMRTSAPSRRPSAVSAKKDEPGRAKPTPGHDEVLPRGLGDRLATQNPGVLDENPVEHNDGPSTQSSQPIPQGIAVDTFGDILDGSNSAASSASSDGQDMLDVLQEPLLAENAELIRERQVRGEPAPHRRKHSLSVQEAIESESSVPNKPSLAWPFHRAETPGYNLLEFPTENTVICDVLATMRVCYGQPDCKPHVAAKLYSTVGCDYGTKLEKEWSQCLSKMRTLLTTEFGDSEPMWWTSLSAPAIASLRGDTLKNYLAYVNAAESNEVPSFLRENADSLLQIAQMGAQQYEDAAMKTSVSNNEDMLHRIGHWVWNDPEDVQAQLSHHGNEPLDDVIDTPRRVLLSLRGNTTAKMAANKVRRTFPRTKVSAIPWSEPIGLGWAYAIMRRFFDGGPFCVSGIARNNGFVLKHTRNSCDATLACVFNYVDVQLGELARTACENGE